MQNPGDKKRMKQIPCNGATILHQMGLDPNRLSHFHGILA